jgi:Uncharacterized protein conserved in bacteria (DUF2252)
MNIKTATRDFEAWLASQITLIERDLKLKHKRMAESPFVFLRGTFYRWMQLWPTVCQRAADAPSVIAIGDLHVENFGTWRDHEGRLVWGINDVDEACSLPYTLDLVRLATSACLAAASRKLSVTRREICQSIQDGYVTNLGRGGQPIVLAEGHRWLRNVAWSDSRTPERFWERLKSLERIGSRPPRNVIQGSLPNPRVPHKVFHRAAGVGSLGRQRFVVLAQWNGGLIAREVKARAPSAASWAITSAPSRSASETLIRKAVRAPDPFFQLTEAWIVRRLAPDCSKVELDDMPRDRDGKRLLRAMGWETANIHRATAKVSATRRHLSGQSSRWLRVAAGDMTDATVADWRDWVGLTK